MKRRLPQATPPPAKRKCTGNEGRVDRTLDDAAGGASTAELFRGCVTLIAPKGIGGVQMEVLKRNICSRGGDVVESYIPGEVTHVISNAGYERTLEYIGRHFELSLQGVELHSSQWVAQSLRQGRRLSALEYAISKPGGENATLVKGEGAVKTEAAQVHRAKSPPSVITTLVRGSSMGLRGSGGGSFSALQDLSREIAADEVEPKREKQDLHEPLPLSDDDADEGGSYDSDSGFHMQKLKAFQRKRKRNQHEENERRKNMREYWERKAAESVDRKHRPSRDGHYHSMAPEDIMLLGGARKFSGNVHKFPLPKREDPFGAEMIDLLSPGSSKTSQEGSSSLGPPSSPAPPLSPRPQEEYKRAQRNKVGDAPDDDPHVLEGSIGFIKREQRRVKLEKVPPLPLESDWLQYSGDEAEERSSSPQASIEAIASTSGTSSSGGIRCIENMSVAARPFAQTHLDPVLFGEAIRERMPQLPKYVRENPIFTSLLRDKDVRVKHEGDSGRVDSPPLSPGCPSEGEKESFGSLSLVSRPLEGSNDDSDEEYMRKVTRGMIKREPGAGETHSKPSNRGPCFKYNSWRGCFMGTRCRFEHVCKRCGAGHPVHKCTQEATEDEQRSKKSAEEVAASLTVPGIETEAASREDGSEDSDQEYTSQRSKLRLRVKRSVAKHFVCQQSPEEVEKKEEQNRNQRITEILQQLQESSASSGDHWRSYAYRKAVAAVRAHPREITTPEEARLIKGIGERIANKIGEIIATGTLRKVEHLKSDEMVTTLNMFAKIWGVGAQTCNKWYAKGYRTLDDLRANPQSLTQQQSIGLKHYDCPVIIALTLEKEFQLRIPRDEVTLLQDEVLEELRAIDKDLLGVTCGSYRRGKSSCGDVDILITHLKGSSMAGVLHALVSRLHRKGFLTDDLSFGSGGNKYMGVCKCTKAVQAGEDEWLHRRIDFQLIPRNEWPYALLYFTGSGHFNRSMRLWARKNGYSLSEKSLTVRLADDLKGSPLPLKIETEEDVFHALGLEYKAPEERNV